MKKYAILTVITLALTACASQVLKEGGQQFKQGNYPAALEKLLPLANKGNAKAQYAVGYMYYYGQGVTEDKTAGIEWIDKAADQGLPQAIQAKQAIENQAKLNPLKHSA